MLAVPQCLSASIHPIAFLLDKCGQGKRTIFYAPAFFSWCVSSDQLTFMRSRSDIHRSACSCGGMASHRFSISASVGLEMAWAALACTGLSSAPLGLTAARAELRRIDVRSIVDGTELAGGRVGCRDPRGEAERVLRRCQLR